MEDRLREAAKTLSEAGASEETVENLCDMLLNSVGEHEKIVGKEVVEATWSWLVHAARNQMTLEEAKQKFEEYGGTSTTGNVVATVYESNRSLLIQQLNSIGWDRDELVDFEWSVSTNQARKPQATVTLQLLQSDEVDPVQQKLTFDHASFQQFAWTIKEAVNAVEKAQKM